MTFLCRGVGRSGKGTLVARAARESRASVPCVWLSLAVSIVRHTKDMIVSGGDDENVVLSVSLFIFSLGQILSISTHCNY